MPASCSVLELIIKCSLCGPPYAITDPTVLALNDDLGKTGSCFDLMEEALSTGERVLQKPEACGFIPAAAAGVVEWGSPFFGLRRHFSLCFGHQRVQAPPWRWSQAVHFRRRPYGLLAVWPAQVA